MSWFVFQYYSSHHSHRRRLSFCGRGKVSLWRLTSEKWRNRHFILHSLLGILHSKNSKLFVWNSITFLIGLWKQKHVKSFPWLMKNCEFLNIFYLYLVLSIISSRKIVWSSHNEKEFIKVLTVFGSYAYMQSSVNDFDYKHQRTWTQIMFV